MSSRKYKTRCLLYSKKILLTMVLVNSFSIYADKLQEQRKDCLEGENNKKTAVNNKELRAHLMACQYPKLPGLWCGKGRVNVLIHIDKTGRVQCASALSKQNWGAMGLLAERTVMQWEFRPFQKDGESIEVKGVIPVNISWDRQITKTCGL
jgi:outer membrane biosynthesis protein TonB